MVKSNEITWDKFIEIIQDCHCVELNDNIVFFYINNGETYSEKYVEFFTGHETFVHKNEVSIINLGEMKDQVIITNNDSSKIAITPLYKKELELIGVKKMKQKLNTITIIFSSAGVIKDIFSFNDTNKGNTQAEKVFMKICRDNISDFNKKSKCEIKTILDDGWIEEEGGNYNSVALVHSS